MIDLRYHIVSLVAVFLALGMGILIGSTLVSSDVVTEQQNKMASQLKTQFEDLQKREDTLSKENAFVNLMVKNYEEYAQTVSAPMMRDRLQGYRIAVVVTGGQQIPAGMLNTLSLAGVKITSTTVILPAIVLDDPQLKIKLCDFYGISHDTATADLQRLVATSVANILLRDQSGPTRAFLQENDLVKFNGRYGPGSGMNQAVQGVVLIGGAVEETANNAENIDLPLIMNLKAASQKIFACEGSRVPISFMAKYQQLEITTIDDVDIAPGQVALVRAMEGETGHYGIKPTARKFMPSLPTADLEEHQ
ncbi:MAG: copper transporter [Solirubrobacterales bacterium]